MFGTRINRTLDQMASLSRVLPPVVAQRSTIDRVFGFVSGSVGLLTFTGTVIFYIVYCVRRRRQGLQAAPIPETFNQVMADESDSEEEVPALPQPQLHQVPVVVQVDPPRGLEPGPSHQPSTSRPTVSRRPPPPSSTLWSVFNTVREVPFIFKIVFKKLHEVLNIKKYAI
jgi:hypothetical protein